MKTYRYFFIGFIFFMVIANTKAQLPIVETNFNWQNCFKVSYFNGGFVSANDGYYVISGTDGTDSLLLNNFHGGAADILLTHTDSLGNIEWKKCYGGSELDWAWSLIESSDGHIFLIGFTDSGDGDISSRIWEGDLVWVVKTNYDGDILWEKTFGVEDGTGFDIRSVLALPDGGIAVATKIQGKTGDVSQYFDYNDIWIVRLNAQGEMLWEKTFGNEGMWDNLQRMILTDDGNILCAGAASKGGGMVNCTLPTPESYNVWLFEIDFDGNILWQQCYGGSNNDLPRTIVELEGNFTVGVFSESWDGDVVNQHGGGDMWLFEIDNNGTIEWSNCLGGSEGDSPKEIFPLSDGGYIVQGYSYSTDGDVFYERERGRNKLWFVKVNKEGIGQYQRVIYTSNESMEFMHHPFIIRKDENRFVIAQEIEAGGPDIICNGNPSDLNEYIWMFEIEFTDQFVSVNELHGQSLNVSPNPANNLMMFELPAIGELYIYSVSGRLLHKAHCLAGDYHYNCGHLSPGVYFYTFMTDEALLHGKVVVE